MTHFDQIEYACQTDVGVRRSHNQDSHAVKLAPDDEQWRERGHLFLVADGMGGHAVGEKASEQAVQVIPHSYVKHAAEGPIAGLRKAIEEANETIHSCGQQNREFEGMGTTGTALVLRPEGAWVGHVGDSRVYRIRAGFIEQLSYDHSLVWEYARIKGIDPDKVKDIPSNRIDRCLGPEASVVVDIEGPYPICAGDIFLLCSDGLSGQVSDGEIGAAATALPPAEACSFLIDLANLRGGPDNITVLIAHVLGGAEAPVTPSGPVTMAEKEHRKAIRLKIPWWVMSLTAGILLALGATWLEMIRQRNGSILSFLMASLCIAAGLVGLGLHYRWERRKVPGAEAQETPVKPRIHRRTACPVDKPILEKLTRVLAALRQQALDKKWEPDWAAVEEHAAKAEDCTKAGDVLCAFRESCRAMLPLTAALARHRNRGEEFNPRWERAG